MNNLIRLRDGVAEGATHGQAGHVHVAQPHARGAVHAVVILHGEHAATLRFYPGLLCVFKRGGKERGKCEWEVLRIRCWGKLGKVYLLDGHIRLVVNCEVDSSDAAGLVAVGNAGSRVTDVAKCAVVVTNDGAGESGA